MKSTTLTSAMMLTHPSNSLESAEVITTPSTTTQRLAHELLDPTSREIALKTVKMSLPNSDNSARSKESESPNSSEILISSDPVSSPKLNSELDSTWLRLCSVQTNSNVSLLNIKAKKPFKSDGEISATKLTKSSLRREWRKITPFKLMMLEPNHSMDVLSQLVLITTMSLASKKP